MAVIVCKMAENNDENYNIKKQEKKVNISKHNKKIKVYVSFTGKKYHFYSLCGGVKYFNIITLREAEKIGKILCRRCRRKRL